MVGMTACATNGQKFISQREPAPVVAATQIPKPEPEPAVEEKPKELFVRQKDLKIRRKAPINETGSLTDLNDPRA